MIEQKEKEIGCELGRRKKYKMDGYKDKISKKYSKEMGSIQNNK